MSTSLLESITLLIWYLVGQRLRYLERRWSNFLTRLLGFVKTCPGTGTGPTFWLSYWAWQLTRLNLAMTLVQLSDLATGFRQDMPRHERCSNFLTRLLGFGKTCLGTSAGPTFWLSYCAWHLTRLSLARALVQLPDTATGLDIDTWQDLALKLRWSNFLTRLLGVGKTCLGTLALVQFPDSTTGLDTCQKQLGKDAGPTFWLGKWVVATASHG